MRGDRFALTGFSHCLRGLLDRYRMRVLRESFLLGLAQETLQTLSIEETETLTRMIAAAGLSRVICTIAELGIADHVDGEPQSVAALAAALNAHERSLYRVLRLAASYGIFEERPDGLFAHTALSRKMRTDAPGSFRAAGRMFHRIFPAWEGLHQAVASGQPSFDTVYGKGLFEYVGEHPDLAPIFDAGMSSFHGHETAAMLEAYDFGEIGTLADIGGGNGSLISAVLNQYSGMRGILFDLGHVTGRAKAALADAGVSDRCSFIEGNFFESIPSGADAYLMRHIIHDWTDEQSVQILSNIRKVIPSHGRVLLVEFDLLEANQAGVGKDADMIMLAFPGGVERTQREYADLYRRSGFEFTRAVSTRSAVSVIEGRPA